MTDYNTDGGCTLLLAALALLVVAAIVWRF